MSMTSEDVEAIEAHLREMERVERALFHHVREYADMTLRLKELCREDRSLTLAADREARAFRPLMSGIESFGLVRNMKRKLVDAVRRAAEENHQRRLAHERADRELARSAGEVESDLERALRRFLSR